MLPLYIVLGFVCILFGLCVWIFEISKEKQKASDAVGSLSEAVKSSTDAQKLSEAYTNNALSKPSWEEAKKEMVNDPASF